MNKTVINKGTQMSEKGYVKLLRAVSIATHLPQCAITDEPHKFESAGQIVKYDPAECAPAPDGNGSKGEALLVQVHICVKCLCHVYTELVRMDVDEAKKRGMFGINQCGHGEAQGQVN